MSDKRGGSYRQLIVWLRFMALGLLLTIVTRSLVTTYRVAGSSMRECLEDGDRILVCELPWVVHSVERDDIFIMTVEGEVVVKRVVACPGDTIAMEAGRIVLNGETIQESIPDALNRFDDFPEYHLHADEYFVLGDNRRVSVDSRKFGPVHADQLIGKVLFRIHGHGIALASALDRKP